MKKWRNGSATTSLAELKANLKPNSKLLHHSVVWKWTKMKVDSIKKELCNKAIIIGKYLFHSTVSEETGML